LIGHAVALDAICSSSNGCMGGLWIAYWSNMPTRRLAGEQRQWCMKQERRTPGYTTDWDGLAFVRA